jgi:peptidoglycan/xylan/chitin deacetylase (PgdA/CDA1 family)
MLHNSIPVVMYHHVSKADRELNVYPEVFEDQLRELSRRGWKTVSGDEFLHFIEDGTERPKKCVLLTFDDGFADNYVFAYPLLKKFGMKAMMFVATNFIADDDVKRSSFVSLSHNDAWKLASSDRRSEVMCTWRELEEMESSGVFDIQCHGTTHDTPALMNEKKYKAVKEDLIGGKAIIETQLSKKAVHFAWPRGHYDDEGIRIALDAGFRALYTTDRGANTKDNLHAVNRLPVKCAKGRWLCGKLPIYSSVFLSKLYLSLRTGI